MSDDAFVVLFRTGKLYELDMAKNEFEPDYIIIF